MTTLHFAYGANMSRAVMQKYAPGARALGRGRRLPIIASSSPPTATPRSSRRAAQTVHGVLWRITPRDRVMLDAWENVGGGPLSRRDVGGAPDARPARRRWSISRGPAPRGGRSPAISSLWSGGGAGMGFAGSLYPFAGRLGVGASARAGRAQDRRVPMTVIRHVVFQRPGAGRRLSRLCRGRGGAALASRAGCATAATAPSKRCSRATPRPWRT